MFKNEQKGHSSRHMLIKLNKFIIKKYSTILKIKTKNIGELYEKK